MSKKEMEKNLDYGDCNNIICIVGQFIDVAMEKLEKTFDKVLK